MAIIIDNDTGMVIEEMGSDEEVLQQQILWRRMKYHQTLISRLYSNETWNQRRNHTRNSTLTCSICK
eukprot:UN29959